jgi:hypothetical protein
MAFTPREQCYLPVLRWSAVSAKTHVVMRWMRYESSSVRDEP